MPKIKLKEWADKHGLSYITANRHFHAGLIPNAQQLDSGTILVEDESEEQTMVGNSSGDAMSLFLKKTVEFSKNNSSVEDFAAFIISNFQLKLNTVSDSPRYSRNKPKTEEVQKHFQKFIPDPKDIEHLKAVKTLLKEGKVAGDVVPTVQVTADAFETAIAAATIETDSLSETNEMDSLFNDGIEKPSAAADLRAYTGVHMYGETPTEGLVTRSVDLNTTPQQINYTGSNSQTFSSSLSPTIVTNSVTPISGDVGGVAAYADIDSYFGSSIQSPFQPTQKELLSATKVIETAEAEPRRRGRKPTFKKR